MQWTVYAELTRTIRAVMLVAIGLAAIGMNWCGCWWLLESIYMSGASVDKTINKPSGTFNGK